jgi:sec-independent protein translocase protein TatA
MFGKTEELIVVLLIVLLLFGGRKIPEIAKGIGQAVKELRKGFSSGLEDESKTDKVSTKKKTLQ